MRAFLRSSPLAISSSIRPSESPPSSLSLAVAVATEEISLARDAEAVVEAIMHARERYGSHTGAADGRTEPAEAMTPPPPLMVPVLVAVVLS